MDKSKNRTDLLAAGRKKLLQFRQKKDNKGSSSQQRKSTNKTAKSGSTYNPREAPPNQLHDQEPVTTPETISATTDSELVLDDIAPLPVVSSLVSLAKGVTGSIINDDSVPVDPPPLPSPRQDFGRNLDEGSERVDTYVPAADDGNNTSSSSFVGSMQGANLMCVEQDIGGNEDGCEVGQQDESAKSRALQCDYVRYGTVVSVSGADSVLGENNNVLLCPIQDAVQKMNKSSIPIQDTQEIEHDHSISRISSKPGPLMIEMESDMSGSTPVNNDDGFNRLKEDPITDQEVLDLSSSNYSHDREGNFAFSSRSSMVETSKCMVEIDEQTAVAKEKDACFNTKFGEAEEVDNFCIPSNALETNNTCEQMTDAYSSETSVTVNKSVNATSRSVAVVDVVASQEVDCHKNSVSVENESRQELEKCSLVTAEENFAHLDDENLQKSTGSVLSTGLYDSQSIVSPESCLLEEVDHLRQHLYLTNVTKDFLNLQLEHMQDKVEHDTQLSEEAARIHGLLKETQEDSTRLNKDLADCKIELQATTLGNEELKICLSSAKEEVEVINNRACEFQNQLKQCQEQSSVLLADVAECKGLLGDLQMENLKLKQDLFSQADEGKKLKEEKEYLICENMRLASGLLEQKQQFVLALNTKDELDNDLKESMTLIEQLTKENISFSISLNVFKHMLKDLNDWHQTLPQAQESEDQLQSHNTKNVDYNVTSVDIVSEKIKHDEESHLHKLKDSVSNFYDQKSEDEDEDSIDFDAFGALKKHLNECGSIIENIEKKIHCLHSASINLRSSASKVAAPGISKLIMAFESKSNVDDPSPALPLIEGEASEDSLKFTKELTHDMRVALQKVSIELEKGALLFRSRQVSSLPVQEAEVDCSSENLKKNDLEVKYHELVNKLTDQRSIVDKLQNLVEAISRNAAEESGRFLNQIEMLQEEVSKGTDIYRPLMDKLQNQIKDISRNASEQAERFLEKIEMLQKQVEYDSTILEKEKHLIRDFISEALEKLDASTGLLVSRDMDFSSHVNASVDSAVTVINGLNEKLATLYQELETKCSSYEDLHKDHMKMQERKNSSVEILLRTYKSLKEMTEGSYLSETEEVINENDDDLLETIHGNSSMLVQQLKKLLNDQMLLVSAKNELEKELMTKSHGVEELNEKCNVLSSNLEDLLLVKVELESSLMEKDHEIKEINNRCFALSKKLENQEENSLHTYYSEGDSYSTPLSHLEDVVSSLLQKYKESVEDISLSLKYLREATSLPEFLNDNPSMPLHTFLNQEIIPKLIESVELQEKVKNLNSLTLEKEKEVNILKESLGKIQEAFESSRSELHVKVTELEESEHRLSSVREKLGIAVTKGKGLIVQRDGLKQSLAEKSGELEKCLQDMRSKETRFHEAEEKLKSYSEADRVEALESELSYIRNSATTFRDSFLLKDSVLQKIEEVLEELDLPEQFHSKDIIEKIELLARFITDKSSSLLMDEEQKNSIGESYSDSGYGEVEAWKENFQPTLGTELYDLRIKCEDLQKKYYGLAEQNDMLEQSLMERNKLVQWWEEVVDRIEMPSNLRSMESEVKIEWLINTYSEVRKERDSLLLKMDNLVESNDSLAVILDESQNKLSELNSEFVTLMYDREFLAESLDKLRHETLEFSEKAVQEKDHLYGEIANLKEKLIEKQESKDQSDLLNEIKRLQAVVCDALPDIDKMSTTPSDQHIEHFERFLMKLVENYKMLNLEKSTNHGSSDEPKMKDMPDEKEKNLMLLKEQIKKSSHDLVLLKEEKDAISMKHHSLILEMENAIKQKDVLSEEKDMEIGKSKSLLLEIDSMCKQREAWQEQLSQEEQKSASMREKLNMAVRKGKGLVQQRDSLKQTIEERNAELERLQNQLTQSASENLSLSNQLAMAKCGSLESDRTLNGLFAVLDNVDFGEELSVTDPVQKLEAIVKLSSDWRVAAVSYDQEAKKAKTASKLLLAELNEVHERVDVLQEELLKAEGTLAECSKQKSEVEAAGVAVVSQHEQFMTFFSEERKKQLDGILQLEAGISELRNQCFSFSLLLSSIFCEDGNVFNKLVTNCESIMKLVHGSSAPNHTTIPSNLQFHKFFNEVKSLATSNSVLNMAEEVDNKSISEHLVLVSSVLYGCMEEIGNQRGKIQKYSLDIQGELSTVMENIEKGIASQISSSESLRREMSFLKMEKTEKDIEITSLQRNLGSLYETCRRLIFKMEDRKVQVIGDDLDSDEHPLGRMETMMRLPSYDLSMSVGKFSLTENDVKAIESILLSTVEGLVRFEEEVLASNQKELKSIISDLQHDLQDKDIQNNRMCGELVSQIKDAEATAKNYSVDLDSAKYEIHQLEDKVIVLENNKELLEVKVKELIHLEALSKDFQDKVRHLTDSLHLKDQEIEGLMQALDEEESQLEDLERRNKGFEKVVQEKSLSLEIFEASRIKMMSKLSTTMNKFDELHFLSESLLAEVENLESQLQERDSEISFLRQEVTKCTKDVLAEQEINRKKLTEMHQLQNCMSTIVSHIGGHDMYSEDENPSQIHDYTVSLDKQVSSFMAKLNDLKTTSENNDALLKIERKRAEEYLSKMKSLESSMIEKESQLGLYKQARGFEQPSTSNSVQPLEIETVRKKGATMSSLAPLARSGRKANNEHVAIGIDFEQENLIEDEDDDKSHGFKALTMSKIVPRATRPISDKIDGLWVSIERFLMRQPTLRLGLIIYWVALHAMLAASI